MAEEKRGFQEKWTNSYFIRFCGTEKVICLTYKQVNLMFNTVISFPVATLNHMLTLPLAYVIVLIS